MDALKNELTRIIAHVKTLPADPTDEQLSKKVCQIAVSLKRYGQVKDIIYAAFTNFGFSMAQMKVINAASFNLDNFLAGLNSILEEIQDLTPSIVPTEEELGSLSKACDKLWELDTNRLIPNHDYDIDLQSGKKAYDQGDIASKPLFNYVKEKSLDKPTYKLFTKLLDNYTANLGKGEVTTPEELQEQRQFLNAIMDTTIMQYVHEYLILSKKTKNTVRQAFIEELNELWFGLYTRKARNDSSGFEHVFLGEIKDGTEITGMHNWLQIYQEEKKGNFNYKGFIKPRRRNNGAAAVFPDDQEQLITMQFEWNGASKMVSSSFIGTSSEFEIALYTLCYYCGQDENFVEVGDYQVKVTVYKWNSGPKTYIATAFPSCE